MVVDSESPAGPIVQMLEAEQRILSALADEVSVDFIEAPLSEVADYFSTHLEIPVAINEAALRPLGISTDAPVTIRIRGNITARSALNLILQGRDLTWVID